MLNLRSSTFHTYHTYPISLLFLHVLGNFGRLGCLVRIEGAKYVSTDSDHNHRNRSAPNQQPSWEWESYCLSLPRLIDVYAGRSVFVFQLVPAHLCNLRKAFTTARYLNSEFPIPFSPSYLIITWSMVRTSAWKIDCFLLTKDSEHFCSVTACCWHTCTIPVSCQLIFG